MKPSHKQSSFSLMITILASLLVACQSDMPAAEDPPEWVNNPLDGAVGSAVTHINGRHAQEELAISRARERLAARYGVELSSMQTINEKVVNDRAYVSSDKQIKQALSKREVKAHVRELWYDKAHDVVWAWVYPVN